jgi:hypothetical protein
VGFPDDLLHIGLMTRHEDGSVEARAAFVDAAGRPVPAGDASAVTAEIEEVETETGYTLNRTYATLREDEGELDNTVAFMPENSDWPKRTWDLYVIEGDSLAYVDTFERLLALLGTADPAAELRAMTALPVWRAAPEAVKAGAYAFLAARAAGYRLADTPTFLRLVEEAHVRTESVEDLAERLDPAGRHVVGWSMEHEDADGQRTVRSLWLVKVAGEAAPGHVVLDVDPARFAELPEYVEPTK